MPSKQSKKEKKKRLAKTWLKKVELILFTFNVEDKQVAYKRDILSAFLHKSIATDKQIMDIITLELRLKLSSHDKLEILGDKVLDLIIVQWLFNKYDTPGFITNETSKRVCRKNLNKLMGRSNLKKLIFHNVLKVEKSSVYGDIFEAIIGAIYKNKGLKACKEFLKKHFEDIYL